MANKQSPYYRWQESLPRVICALSIFLAIMIMTGDSYACRPKYINCPDTLIPVNHCRVAYYDLDANSEDDDNCPVTYSIISCSGQGAASINPNSGQLTYLPAFGEAGSIVSIVVDVCHEDLCAIDKCEVRFLLTNNPPRIDCGTTYHRIYAGYEFRKTINLAFDPDYCDVSFLWIESGPGSIDDNGVYSWTPDPRYVGRHRVEIAVTDGYDSRSCSFTVDVINPHPYEVKIAKLENVSRGEFVDVDVLLSRGSEEMGGFNFLIGYDASALTFTTAALGQPFVDCGWEYFTYRYNWNGNCGEDCPSGLIRLVAMAETNNGPVHPSCYIVDGQEIPTPLAAMSFYVSNDISVTGRYHPIEFYWMDCGDNSIALRSGDTLAISREVYNSYDILITDPPQFPGWAGTPDTCLLQGRVSPVRFVDFRSGGIRMKREPIQIGDINLNGLPYEVADWLLFKKYMLIGLEAFYEINPDPSDVWQMRMASDVNHDGIDLQLEDLIYMYRIIFSDTEPCSTNCVEGRITADISWDGLNRIVDVGSPGNELASICLLFDGEIVPEPDIDTSCFPLAYYHHEGQTVVLILPECNPDQGGFNECRLLHYDGAGSLRHARAADFYGNLVTVDFLLDVDGGGLPANPSEYQLSQNQPNPFNPATEIRFNLPRSTYVTVDVFNALGEKIANLVSRQMAAGEHRVVWNGRNDDGERAGSGIYFYRLETDDFTESRKMILLK